MKKVVKFGGSSLASARQFKKVGDIIRADKTRRFVIPSAPGKRNSKDTKVTDMLYECYAAASTGASYKKILDAIKARYQEIIDGLELNLNLDHEFATIEENFVKGIGKDYAASRGEYLNGIVMANYLGYEFIDAAEVIFFDEHGNFEAELTNQELSERLEHVERAVIPGFYGSKHDGSIKTFSRGGSDVTGSIVADIDRDSFFSYREDRVLMEYACAHVSQLTKLFIGNGLDDLRILHDTRICYKETGYIGPVLI